ncbi:MAG: 50S ribosomal protein L9 [Chloroflexi bacterium]|nr:50S ribosomal protein L9 [Chloroflexota bacterium]
MKVLLLHDVPNVGRAGEIKEVAEGYGRNYLIPRGLARLATAEAVTETKQRQEAAVRRQARADTEARSLADRIGRTTLDFRVRVGEQGRLYGSITAADVAERLQALIGHEIDKRKVGLEEPIRQLGSYQVPVRLTHQLVPKVTVNVEPEAATSGA